MDQINDKVDRYRHFELISNPIMQRDHLAILQASGRTLSTLSTTKASTVAIFST